MAFSKGLYVNDLPPLGVDEPGCANWLLWKAMTERVAVVAASEMVLAVHQHADVILQLWDEGEPHVERAEVRRLLRKLEADGNVIPVATSQQRYDASLVALPAERVREMIVRLNEGTYRERRTRSAGGLRWSVVARGRRVRSWLTSRTEQTWREEGSREVTSGERSQ